MFTTKGIIVLENNGIDEDKLMDDIMGLGGSDFTMDEETAEIETEPNDLHNVREGLEAKGYKVISADIDRIPSTYTSLTDEEAIKKMNNLLDALEDNDDVQNVYHNWDMPEEPDED
jgi:transcriptional/translational regulatory protein YebC/TACO1